MSFQRVVERRLPDGSSSIVYPFHISLEGMESIILCRDYDDYDQLDKALYLGTWKTNCLTVIQIAMSNHGHSCVLARDLESALRSGELAKKRYSQYLSWKYKERNVLARSSINVQYLDSDWYVRNALAYIARNALDAGSRIEDYPWSGYRGMFVEGRCPHARYQVSQLSVRQQRALFHTHENLSSVPWLLNADGNIEPASACDYTYLESAFNHDQAFFLKTIGTVNTAEMKQKLVLNSRSQPSDTEMLAIVSDLANKWFHKTLIELSPELKARLLPYLYRGYRTSIPQLARCLQLPREIIRQCVASPH